MESVEHRLDNERLLSCIYYNLVHDLNKCCTNLVHLTCALEQEDQEGRSIIYIEPWWKLRLLNYIYYLALNGEDKVYVEACTILQFHSYDLISRYSKSLQKKHGGELSLLTHQIDAVIFQNGLTQSKIWVDLHELITKKSDSSVDDTVLEEETEKLKHLIEK